MVWRVAYDCLYGLYVPPSYMYVELGEGASTVPNKRVLHGVTMFTYYVILYTVVCL